MKPARFDGNALRTFRKAAGLTVRALAPIAGMSYVEVSYYENGRRQPRWADVGRLAVAVGRMAGDLLVPARPGDEMSLQPAKVARKMARRRVTLRAAAAEIGIDQHALRDWLAGGDITITTAIALLTWLEQREPRHIRTRKPSMEEHVLERAASLYRAGRSLADTALEIGEGSEKTLWLHLPKVGSVSRSHRSQPRRRLLAETDRPKLIAMRIKGAALRKISDTFGISLSTVHNTLRHYAPHLIRQRGGVAARIEREELALQLERGVRVAEIAAQQGVSRAAVYAMMKKLGLKPNGRSR